MKYSYWYGPDDKDRRVTYAKEFRPEYQENGDDLQRRVRAVLVAFRSATGIELEEEYSSGWRPPTVNEATANAGKLSNHLIANAGDVRDTPNGEFAWWCYRNLNVLEQHGLWMEHPVATVLRAYKTAKAQNRAPTPWCHLQRMPPKSHARCYYPDTASVKEWEAFRAAGGRAGASFEDWARVVAPKAAASSVASPAKP